MDTLQEAGVRLQEHITRRQIRHRGIKLRRSISPPLWAMTGQTILLVELLASHQIPFRCRNARGRSDAQTERGERTHHGEEAVVHRLAFPPDRAQTPLAIALRHVLDALPKPRPDLIEQPGNRSVGRLDTPIGILARRILHGLKRSRAQDRRRV